MPALSLGEDGESKLCQFVIDNVSDDIIACALDVDSIYSPELCLAFAMTLRLSIFELKGAALMPVLFVSNATQDLFYGYKYSPIILTRSIAVEIPDRAVAALSVMEPLNSVEYKTLFLDLIKVLPNATEGRHSLANQWGADVLHRIVLGPSTDNSLIQKARRSLYFRYILSLTLKVDDIEALAKGHDTIKSFERMAPIDAEGKKILLIDDEADKGWEDVLCRLLKGATFKTISEQTQDYKSLSDNARNEIERGNYDLIFLDLRMNGVSEESVLNPEDFSGMKILRAIKSLNKGTQVIMFTASNKAWNMKALLDSGADGYYIKESPEYVFPHSYSMSNACELLDSIKRCLNNGYLRDIFRKVKKIKELIEENKYFYVDKENDKTQEILSSIDIAFDLLSKSNNNSEYRSYAYLQLFLVIEEYVKLSSVFCEMYDSLYLCRDNNAQYCILKDKEVKGKSFSYNSVITMKSGTGHFVLEKGIYESRFLETNFLVSSLLIFKFSEENSSVYQWTKIYKVRNYAAHPKDAIITEEDFHRILTFMLYFFDPQNVKWRDPLQAFPRLSMADQLEQLKNKFNRR
ncbi:hypothetical protein BARVI_12125 [Barnesiella viscericola DSM 18177]|uniref:Response regulatory domain-containing protein n=2 Tax=Barnesiella viscericola TaxID=397865 RepID=W0EWP1_9BACT|nr:hypothetical protein BARVI_12125 [Barnesiella viscericola DSM 18177]